MTDKDFSQIFFSEIIFKRIPHLCLSLIFIERILPDDKHPQAQASSAISYLVKEQSQVMLKNQQSQWQESFENCSSSAQMSNEETGVEQNPTAMTTDEIMTAKSLDDIEQPLDADDAMNICKVIIPK